MMKIYTDFNLATWLRIVKFTEFLILNLNCNAIIEIFVNR